MGAIVENKVGFKETKLGWVPNDWSVTLLKSLVDPKRKIRYGIVQPGKFDPDGRYLLRGQDYSSSKGWNKPENLFKVSDEVESRYVKARLSKDDLIITIVGAGTGYVAQIPEWLDGANITQTTARIAIDKNIAEPNFYKQYLNSDLGKKQVYRFVKGGAQPGLNVGDVEKFKILFPPLLEQQKIAKILSAWDKAIEKLEQLISEKEQLKKGLMQQLLTGEKRFPGFTDEWEEVKLGDVYEIVGGGTPDTNNLAYWEGSIQWYTPTEIKSKYVSKSVRTITEKGLANSSAKLLPAGTLLFTSRATIGDVGFTTEQATTNQGFQSFLPNSDNELHFLYYWILQNRHEFIRRSSGSTFLEISKKEVQKVKISLPSKQEQKKIADALGSFDREIESLNAELSQFKNQKKGLTQQLLTGKITVSI
ncbi:restriction endonuclease subunit S [Paracrocinitomix mangrovi]|uniref:restriction endonuclease subunit S n=1 Tax=Paracrocinitomix mangrovi TaxID=2862509 RepID=UPI001C8D91E7|nr:restriction endonuclease subunit S [Paracrocinitomix mangrovi]UKN01191.1 restriction endonuclease subunit S [Paracrocinitomix mangrovi]